MTRRLLTPTRVGIAVVLAVLLGLVVLGGTGGSGSGGSAAEGKDDLSPAAEAVGAEGDPIPRSGDATAAPDPPALGAATASPRWQTEPAIPPKGMMVAYYGTAGTGALGVLGENRPAKAYRRLLKAAAPFERPGRPVRPAFELIVSIADAYPGKDGDFSHDLRRRQVREYVDAARDLGVVLILDLQTGRSNFLKVAKRWEWALEQPHVGLALDPEWRMRRGQVPGRVIGAVRAEEVNRVSRWLAGVVVERDLPEKIFMLHQFRTSMLPDIGRIKPRDGLSMVQHVDGFGTRGQKRDTYRAVARPDLFEMGFKLFYDEDVNRMGAKAVHQVRPRVRFVSFQ